MTTEVADYIYLKNRLLAKLMKMKFISISKVLTMRDFQYQWIEFCKKSNRERLFGI